jgi:hypothetical protein
MMAEGSEDVNNRSTDEDLSESDMVEVRAIAVPHGPHNLLSRVRRSK